ncbi:MAG: cytochrome b/b6 domain-containing protein [Pseudomonadota bacterium]
MEETFTYQRRKVYDGILRLIHAWNGLAIVFLIVTVWLSELFEEGAGERTLWQFHAYLGYALVVGLAARLAWGLVGPRHARFSDMWHPAQWWRALRRLDFSAPPRYGHHVLASGVYLAVYVLLLAMAATGLALAAIELSMGPLTLWLGDAAWLKDVFEEPHEAIYSVLMAFVAAHVGALIWHERAEKAPLAQSMVSGYQYQITERKGDA